MERLRVRLRKGEGLRFISHLDMARHLVRAVRRSRLPVAYSQGFSPRPRIQFGVPLFVGATSRSELLDVIMATGMTREQFGEALSRELPCGLDLVDAWPVPLDAPSLEKITEAISYRASGVPEKWDAKDTIADFLGREEVKVACERRGAGGERGGAKKLQPSKGRFREVNIRSPVRELRFVEDGGRFIELTLLTSSGGGPKELLRWFAMSGGWGEGALERVRIERMEQMAMVGGKLLPITAELSRNQREGLPC